MKLERLWEKLGMAPQEEWQDIEIIKVQVSVEKRTWRLILSVAEPREAGRWEEAAKTIQEKVPEVDRVEILTVCPDQDRMKAFIATNWGCLIEECFAGIEVGAEGMSFEMDKRHLTIRLDKAMWHKAVEKEVPEKIQNWFRKNYLLYLMVSLRHSDDEVEEKVLPNCTLQTSNVVESLNPPKRKSRSPKKKIREKPEINGKLLKISELQEGLRDVVIKGEILSITSRRLKDGGTVILLAVTDHSDTITVKSFGEVELTPGEWILAKGGVRYDAFEKEEVLFAEAVKKAEPDLRKDPAPDKRVELHLHTMMSTLDAVTEVEELMSTVQRFGHKAVAITDHGCVQAFPYAYEAAKNRGIKVIYGVEGYLVNSEKTERPFHIIILVKNREGLKNLYHLVSNSYLYHFYRMPRIPRHELMSLRDGLLLGTACERGELMRALLEGKEWEEVKRIAEFYDYLEIQPIANNEFMVREGLVTGVEELRELNRKIVRLGEELGKPVVATGDVHFLEPHHEVFRRILQAGKGMEDAENQAPLYFRTTGEMLQEFSYLGEEKAYEVVVENTAKIADMCEELTPVPKGYFSPRIKGAAEKLTSLVWEKAGERYGNPLPPEVERRLTKELASITTHGFSELYLMAYALVNKSRSEGYLVGSRGSVGSSLAAFVIGITEVNPLPPHYICTCGYCEFVEGHEAACGPDLPAKECPICKRELKRDGFDIPFETFLGFEGDKVPDIDLNFSGEYQSKAHQFVEEMFGKERVFRAGTISTIGEKTAYGFIKNYQEENGLRLRRVEVERLVRGITGVKRTTGQHPGGLIIVPSHLDVHDFTPVQHPADDVKSEVVTTHFDYEALSGVLVKMDVLGHDDPTVIKMLEDLTGVDATAIPLDEPQTLRLFSSVEPLGVTPSDIGSEVGTFGVPEFGTRFVRQMLEATRPSTFSELVRISGLSHGTNVWTNNAQDLIRTKTATLKEVIATRDDIMTYLIQKGLDKKEAFKIMERVRKGQGLGEKEVREMKKNGVADWYIDSCQKIQYMFPKAHAVAYVIMAFRIAYFKVYYPLAFYASFFTIRAQDFDDAIMEGYEAVQKRLEEIEKAGNAASPKEKNLVPVLEVALEMWARGFRFYPVDLYRSDAQLFRIHENGLLLPFSALGGVGQAAAQSLASAREQGPFASIEDLQKRSRVNKSVVDILERYGCLSSLPKTQQMSLF